MECSALAGPHGASDEMFEDLLDEAKCGAPDYTPQTLRIKGTNKPQTYGELQPALVAKLLRQVRAGPGDTLVDIGSGCGTLCFQAACQAGCAAHGIEIRRDLHAVAGQLAPLVAGGMARAGLFCGAVRLHCGDVRQPPEALLAALREATVVLVNNVVFDEPLNQAIFRLLKSVLRQGCRVLSFRDCFPRLRASTDHCVGSDHLLSRFHLPPHSFVSEPNVASWTCSPVRYLIYTVIPPNPVGDYRPGRAADPELPEWSSKAAQVAAWRAECEQLARGGVDGDYTEIQVRRVRAGRAISNAFWQVTRRHGLPLVSHPFPRQVLVPLARAPRSSSSGGGGGGGGKRRKDKKKERAAPRSKQVVVKPRRPHWEYVEEKAFYLPPSPEGKRKKRGALAVVDEIQTRNLNARHKAIIRERPSADAVEEPRMTRRQRRERGEEVVELRKTVRLVSALLFFFFFCFPQVIWNAPERCEDYCCVCCEGGELLCCDGNCFRSFHLACLQLPAMPEGDFLCDKCARESVYHGQEECASCGILGLTDVGCGCGLHFHSDCVGVAFGSLAFVCGRCALRGEGQEGPRELMIVGPGKTAPPAPAEPEEMRGAAQDAEGQSKKRQLQEPALQAVANELAGNPALPEEKELPEPRELPSPAKRQAMEAAAASEPSGALLEPLGLAD